MIKSENRIKADLIVLQFINKYLIILTLFD
jgi:hypothetical protein